MAARRPGGGESDRGRGRGRGVPAARVSRGQERWRYYVANIPRTQIPRTQIPRTQIPNPKVISQIPNPKNPNPKSQLWDLGFGQIPKSQNPKTPFLSLGFGICLLGFPPTKRNEPRRNSRFFTPRQQNPRIEQRTLRFEQIPRTQELGFDKSQGGEKSLGFASQIPSSANPKVYKPKLGICVWDLLSNTNPKSRISQGDALSLGYAEHIPSLPYPNDDIPSFFFNLGI